MPVWEITGAEFTKSEAHTAAGISIRFPRITKLRDDKSAKQANDLQHIQHLYEASKSNVNVDLLMADCDDDDEDFQINSKLKLDAANNGNNSNEAAELKPKKETIKIKEEKTTPKKQKRESNNDAYDSKLAVKKVKTEISSSPRKQPKQQQLQSVSNFFKPTVKTEKLDTTLEKSKSKPISTESYMFKDLIAHFDAGTLQQSELREKFLANGGQLTRNSKEANIVFHANAQVRSTDLSAYRYLIK